MLEPSLVRLTTDLKAMLADGEIDRAAYHADDLRRLAEREADPQLIAAVDQLETALAEARLADARRQLERLAALL